MNSQLLESFIYAVNTIVPIFIIVLLGYLLMRWKFINVAFTSVADRMVFKIGLPVMLFTEVATSSGDSGFDWKYIGYCVCGVCALFLILLLVVPLFIKGNAKRGAFIQGVYRSNFAILGMPLANSMFGDEGSRVIAMMMPFAIVMFNVLAVVILSIFAPEDVKPSKRELLKKIIKSIVTNPLIIACALGLLFMLTSAPIPTFASKTLGYLSNMVMPLSLICIGSTLNFKSIHQRFGYAITAAVLKTAVVPLAAVTVGALIGFRGAQLGVIMILFGGPTAVSSFIMAKNMKSDYELAGQIILMTTVLCMLTLFTGCFVLDYIGLI